MSDELKSAWEVALEKMEGREDLAVEKLTTEQKQAIRQIRQNYKARLAEAEISTQTQSKKVVESGKFDEVEKIQQHLVDDKQRLNREMEQEIEKIRNPE
ncbi:MAG: hypothetical protein O6826_10640 [Acidobacteria bacterium]|nr:hypothetical protein [Acidobacteriota bacterium]MCZ6768259.1 hypothetical protein [Acidobacteriota bacterium]MCZ6876619.1 hypothetical protein [Acidobacteriota bacterium]